MLSLVLAAGCSSKKPAPAAPAAAATVTLKDLQNGDRACYVVYEQDGEEVSQEGSFELCSDARALIGKQVTFTTEKANVLAASCEGDVDCGKSDEVDLIVTITAAP